MWHLNKLHAYGFREINGRKVTNLQSHLLLSIFASSCLQEFGLVVWSFIIASVRHKREIEDNAITFLLASSVFWSLLTLKRNINEKSTLQEIASMLPLLSISSLTEENFCVLGRTEHLWRVPQVWCPSVSKVLISQAAEQMALQSTCLHSRARWAGIHVVLVCKPLKLHWFIFPNGRFPVGVFDLSALDLLSIAARRGKLIVRS